ncbi:DUF309 domain-containing protein [Devosia sp.]|uniref:DUF309 domain-containing protein n=1 Tax=Devosia sp. TaxID=1871048 RepID=UPI00273338D0|nr:DUF309 domain-containing protein [Devosia sp.]MDP2779944.1 DUF309 domain-containing protein [Devosia sp.]
MANWQSAVHRRAGAETGEQTMGHAPRPRLLPRRTFPAYAYLPGGHQPHPVREATGHSYQHDAAPPAQDAVAPGDALAWGIDLFNHGYYWEAHEAWEPIWLAARGNVQDRALFKGLIMLAATGVKIRERKWQAAARHAGRAARALRQLPRGTDTSQFKQIGMAPEALASLAEAAARSPINLPMPRDGKPEPVFPFLLGSACEQEPSPLAQG